jgi:hypothetical protein
MTVLAITGTARHKKGDLIRQTILDNKPPQLLVTGGAHGVDTTFAGIAMRLWPTVPQRIILPQDAPYDVYGVDTLESMGASVVYASAASTQALAYMARNDALVDAADELWAFPESSTEAIRSGTWATIRRARKKGIPVYIYTNEDA